MQHIKEKINSISAVEKSVDKYNYVLNLDFEKCEEFGYFATLLHNKVCDTNGLPGKRWSFTTSLKDNRVSFYFVDKNDLTFWNLKFK